MSNGNGLRPRPGPAPKLLEGPKEGQRSLYHQQVLDEDSYTEALSNIIERDFFPHLPHLHATNDYLSALATNDPDLLSSSIRQLARIAQEKEDAREGREPRSERARRDEQRREFETMHTPSISLGRTPLGARGWDTPREVSRRPREAEDALDRPGPSKRRKPVVRDDLSLDAFQRNFTSEDNASFAHIVEEENRQRREVNNWAFEAERYAETKRIAGEERRKLILDAATSGNWRVDADGRRLIGGLDEGGRDREVGEAWKERKMIAASDGAVEPARNGESSTALVKGSSSGALVKATDASSASALPPPEFKDEPLPDQHPLSKALAKAGLPPTALVSTSDGAIVPHRDAAAGSGDGRGRGDEEAERRARVEKHAMGEDIRESKAVPQWKYKAMNGLMFPPDANTKPYPVLGEVKKAAAHPPTISHRNTRLPDDEEDDPRSSRTSSRRASSIAGSWVDAAVQGREYVSRGQDDEDDEDERYPLLPEPEEDDIPPLMTMSALGGSADISGPSFRLPENQRRDEIGRKLGAKASRDISHRAKGFTPRPERTPGTPSLADALRAAAGRTQRGDRRGGGDMLPPSTPRRTDLTPAAKSLLDRSLGRTPKGRSGGLGLKSRGSMGGAATGWSPSPKR